MTYQTIQPFLTPMSVVIAAPAAEITCTYCQKIAHHCDGQRNVREVAQLTHLPWSVCVKLVERAIKNQWFLLSGSESLSGSEAQSQSVPARFWAELQEALSHLNATGQWVERANRMLGSTPEELSAQQLGDYLIALELAAPEPERLKLISLLNHLRLKYAV